ncbi:MurR/RpiR family transcriptional regulator [Youngiibacter fragilis]|uniref:HTH rpiR-type domain-containing protein n=1 Tax=Youngiibacter fragilis 232.1 TaxID=994573 RepID=V7I532_9CLOT|nr:MurR/RpiR family transcriptional regulator [Youngiibacter fragilis]ETA80406.1 hypothetical protein T472_0211625 [Youngiibacter fragilis 232.1]
MRINRLSLLNSLFSVINENNQDDSYFVLAHYFLVHYHELSDLNIYDVADDCFVSRSSVRRFCQSIGYDNFKDLKTEFNEYDDQLNYYMQFADREDFRQCLTNEIDEMIGELDRRMNTEEVGKIAERLHDSRYVVFLTSDASTSRIKEFQQSMILSNRIVRIISEAYTDNTLLSMLNEKDYLITISASGKFADASEEIVKRCCAYKSLVTLNRDPKYNDWYDKVYHLSAKDRSKGKSVYGRYGIDYMFDVVFSHYIRKYGRSK